MAIPLVYLFALKCGISIIILIDKYCSGKYLLVRIYLQISTILQYLSIKIIIHNNFARKRIFAYFFLNLGFCRFFVIVF